MQFKLGEQLLLIEDFDYYGITPTVARSYYESLCAHVAYVQEAGRRLGLDLAEHDYSKLSLAEFPHYARQFHGDKCDPDGFATAWLHHIHANDHHWQHFIFPDGLTPRGSNVEDGCLKMGKRALREMVADWQGASRAYTGSWDMEEWLVNNLCKIRLHTATWACLARTLTEIGYDGKGLVYGRA